MPSPFILYFPATNLTACQLRFLWSNRGHPYRLLIEVLSKAWAHTPRDPGSSHAERQNQTGAERIKGVAGGSISEQLSAILGSPFSANVQMSAYYIFIRKARAF